MTGRILVLNGVGSVGKSSVARAVQALAGSVWLHAPMDAFLEMLPAPLQDSAEGFAYLPGPGGVRVESGPVGRRLMAALPGAVLALAEAGNVIFDAVLGAEEVARTRQVLAAHHPVFVGLTAPLTVLEAREAARGDRMIGLARDQVTWVHHGVSYDLMVDCADRSPGDVAALICERFRM